jgi:hypothetical protein
MRCTRIWLTSQVWLRLGILPLVLTLGLAPWLNFSDKATPLRADEQAKLTDPVQTVDNSAEEDGKLFAFVDHSLQVAPEKQFVNPDAGLTSAERMAKIEAGRARQRDFFNQFVASGQDPRSLPRISVSPYSGPIASLKETVATADAIVAGTVSRQDFSRSGDGVERSRARISVDTIIKDSTVLPDELVIDQTGGPVLGQGGPALFQLDVDELMLKGDKGVLFLRASNGRIWTLPGSGIVFIQDGLAVPEASSRFAGDIRGLTLPQLLALIDANR